MTGGPGRDRRTAFAADFVLRGYRADGAPDQTFHAGTALVVPMPNFFGADSRVLDAAGTDATGRITLMTTASDMGIRDAVGIQHVTRTGQLEPGQFVLDAFPAGLPDIAPGGWGEGFALLPSGAVRLCVRGDEAAYLIGLRPDGTPDPAFGDGPAVGYQVLPAAWRPDCPTLAAHRGGALYLASEGSVKAFAADGSPMASWGGSGSVTLTVPGSSAVIQVLTVSATGVVYAGGWTGGNGQPEKRFLAKIGPGGVPQSSFGTAGIRTYSLPRRSSMRIAPATGDRAYLTFGSAQKYVRASLLRVSTTTGAPDTTFGSGGALQFGFAMPAPIALPVSSTRVLVGVTTSRPTTRYGVEVTARRA